MTGRVLCGSSVTGVYYWDFMQKLLRKVHKNRPQLLVARPLILHHNARPHIADIVTKKLRDYRWDALSQGTYSPDMSPLDFDLLEKQGDYIEGLLTDNLKEIKVSVKNMVCITFEMASIQTK